MSLSLNRGRPIEILLVEDEIEEAELTLEVLHEGRIANNAHWVKDGEEAIAFLRRQGRHANAPRPDLILLDLDMPRMNGREVLAIVKDNADWKRIPVVIMTSCSAERDIHWAYDHHANCYVTKPLDNQKFIEAVRSIEDFWLATVRLPAA
jgi:CheY-like chemotaxis protein